MIVLNPEFKEMKLDEGDNDSVLIVDITGDLSSANVGNISVAFRNIDLRNAKQSPIS